MTNDQSLISLDKENIFLWNQLFIFRFVNSHNIDMDKLKRERIEQCRSEYKNNETKLEKINDFDQNCISDNVLN
jgi:hypothetical protein